MARIDNHMQKLQLFHGSDELGIERLYRRADGTDPVGPRA